MGLHRGNIGFFNFIDQHGLSLLYGFVFMMGMAQTVRQSPQRIV
jgi:hypothetical protein